MKRVVLPFFSFLLLSTLSHALPTDTSDPLVDLTQVLKQPAGLRIIPSSDGGDSPKILLPTDNSPETDLTKSLPVEGKYEFSFDPQESGRNVKTTPVGFTQVDLDFLVPLNRHPVYLRNRYPFPVTRFSPHRCHHRYNRFFRHPGRFDMGWINGVDLQTGGLDFPAETKVLHHRHVARKFPEAQHQDHHDDDDVLKKIRKFLTHF